MRTLEVRLHGERIGTLSRERSGKVTFALDGEWKARPDRPILSVALEHAPGATPVRKLFVAGTGLPPYFENLLPEHESRKTLASVHGLKASDGFGLLERAGRNLFGAVEVVGPAHEVPATGISEVGKDQSSVEVDFLLAGMQRKLLLSRVAERITAGADEWIIKIPDFAHSGLVRNEYAMMRMAKAAGFDVADVEITTIRFPRDNPHFSDMPETMDVLAVRRFDRRPDGTKVHAEEVHQMFGSLLPDEKYSVSSEAVGARLKDSGIDPRKLLAQLVFHAISGNGDAHAKNFAVLYPDGRTAELSPMYDVVSTVVYGNDLTMALPIGGSREWKDINMQSFERFGAKLGIPVEEVHTIVNRTIDATLGAWHEVREEFPEHLRPYMERHFTHGLTLTRLYINEHGFPPPLPRIPDYPADTHVFKRTLEGTVVRRIADKKVENTIDAAVVSREGREEYWIGGRKVPPDAVLGSAPDHKQ